MALVSMATGLQTPFFFLVCLERRVNKTFWIADFFSQINTQRIKYAQQSVCKANKFRCFGLGWRRRPCLVFIALYGEIMINVWEGRIVYIIVHL